MKQTINEYQFREAFRAIRPDNFYHGGGLVGLYRHLVELEDGTGEELELDVIAICCDYTEYESIEEAADQYNVAPDELRDSTDVIDVPGGSVIIRDF